MCAMTAEMRDVRNDPRDARCAMTKRGSQQAVAFFLLRQVEINRVDEAVAR